MKKFDYILFIAILIISAFGVVMVYSSSYVWAEYKFLDPFKYVKNQGLFLVIGIFLMLFISKINYNIYLKYSNKILIISVILLILVLIPGIGSIRNGSRSWFGIGSFGIQPSELSKIALIIFTSKYSVNNRNDLRYIKKGVLPIFLVCLFIFFLIMLQPDFGTGVIIVMTIVGLLFVSGVNMNFFIRLFLIGLCGISGLIIAAPYRLKRILSFLNSWSDPLGSGFQIIQSLYAIGPGGLCQWR